MNIAVYLVEILFAAVLIRELLYLRNLKIHTKKSIGELLIVCISIIALIVMTVIFAKNIWHYILGGSAIVLLIADWSKQGISGNGLLVIARGKQLYTWSEISKAIITISNTVTVDYYNLSNTKIVTHVYAYTMYDAINDSFNNHNLIVEVVNNSK